MYVDAHEPVIARRCAQRGANRQGRGDGSSCSRPCCTLALRWEPSVGRAPLHLLQGLAPAGATLQGPAPRPRRGHHLELLLLEHVGVGGAEDVVRQLGLTVDVDRRGGLAAQELTEDLAGPVGELTGQRVSRTHRPHVSFGPAHCCSP